MTSGTLLNQDRGSEVESQDQVPRPPTKDVMILKIVNRARCIDLFAAKAEARTGPDDGKEYTFSELQRCFEGEYSAEDLQAYWL